MECDVTREKERQGQEHEVRGDAVECDVTEGEKEVIIQQFRVWGWCEAAIVQFAEDDAEDVEQKMQWFLDMSPVTQEQRQMIAPVMRWAIEVERKRRNGVTEDGKENASVEPEVRQQLRHEECGMSSVQGGRDEARGERHL